MLTENSTIREASKYVYDHLLEGVTCPCCMKNRKMYCRPLNAPMARSLIWLVKVSGGDWIEVNRVAPKWVIQSRELSKLSYWGFIEQKVNDDPSKRTSGKWRPTNAGVEFALAITWVPSHVYIFDGEVVDIDTTKFVDIHAALGKEFNYKELMEGI